MTLTGRSAGDEYAWRHLRLRVRARGTAPTEVPLAAPKEFDGVAQPPAIALESVDPAGHGAFCLGRMLGNRLVAVAGMRVGNNCCSGIVTVPITPEVGQPHWFITDGNGVAVATLGARARLVSNFWMGCTTFWACAGGGDSIVINDTDGTHLADVSKTLPGLLAADARYWRAQISPASAGRAGWIAAWIADECRLGHEQDAWRWLDDQLAAGRLNGDRDQPGGKRLVAFLHKFLPEQGFCSG